MRTLFVDDEQWMLRQFEYECKDIPDIELVGKFRNPKRALEFAKKEYIELAVLDIEMPEMNGLELADKLKELHPEMSIIFISAYERYMTEAINEHRADCFLMKPYTKDNLERAVGKVRLLSGRMKKKIYMQTFGVFDVLVNGERILFQNGKAKELLAFLVDARGSAVSDEQACEALWPLSAWNDELALEYEKVQRKLQDSLRAVRINDIIACEKDGIYLRAGAVECDYFAFLDGDMNMMGRFRGEYMNGYVWAGNTERRLARQAKLLVGDEVGQGALCASIRCTPDERLTLTYMNDSFLFITGYSREEIKNKFNSSLRAMIDRDDFDSTFLQMAKRPEQIGEKEIEYRLLCRSGAEKRVASRVELVKNERGGVEYEELECLVMDVSGRSFGREQHNEKADSLTGLHNKRSFMKKIEEYIEEYGASRVSALVMMEINGIDLISRKYGRQFAETVLKDTSAILLRSFRSNDVAGHLDGDAMGVFIKKVPSTAFVRKKATAVAGLISRRLFEKTDTAEFSCSFGIAIYPSDAKNTAGLCRCASMALAKAKDGGKNIVCTFEDTAASST